MLYGLPNVDEAARQGMAERRTGAPDDHDWATRAVLELDDNVRRNFRRAWTRHQAPGIAGRAR
jgi:predicted secreted protein